MPKGGCPLGTKGKALLEGYQSVRPLESLLTRDLRELRQALNIAPPTRYLAVTDQARAMGRAIPQPPGRTL